MIRRRAAPLDAAAHVEFDDRAAWREWLEQNHAQSAGAWLVTARASAAAKRLSYEAAVEEALCFGWVDGQAATVDEERGKQYFAPRRAGSPWATSNKARVARLIADGRMTPAGMTVVERAKADGSWIVLESAERLEVPPDLDEALDAAPPARSNWNAFPPSARKQMLSWIALAKRPATRARRVEAIAVAAARNERALG